MLNLCPASVYAIQQWIESALSITDVAYSGYAMRRSPISFLQHSMSMAFAAISLKEKFSMNRLCLRRTIVQII